MNVSFQSALFIASVTLCVFVAGNYLVNRLEGMCPRKNWHETRLWGAGFVIYAVLDYVILTY